MHEFDKIARIARIVGASARPKELVLGIGDDCATLDASALQPGEQLVWTIDAQIEGVHFRRELLSWEDVGYRATVAATSDVLAMGARPIAALAAWTTPRELDDDAVEGIARGQRQACDALSIAIVGGNVSGAGELSITTTVLGATSHPIGRAGARVGDRLVVVGALGEASLGFSWLMRRGSDDGATRVVAAWRRPKVLLEESRALAAIAHAMIDVSDGLAQDVGHLARASGVRVRIDVAALHARRHDETRELAALLRAPLDDMELSGGEDYALVAAVPQGVALPAGADVIGAIEEGAGVSVVSPEGHALVPPAGFRH